MKHFSLMPIAAGAILSGLSFATSAFGAEPITNLPPDNFTWERTPEGVAFAPLEGNRFEEAHMSMVKLPAGVSSPMHIKSADMYGVVVSGILSNVAQGAHTASEPPLPAGSYYKIPAGLPHVSACVSKVDCVVFLYQDDKFDFIPVGQ